MRILLKLFFSTLLLYLLHANCDSSNNTNKDTQNKQAIASYISSLKPVQDSVTLSHTVALSEYSKYTGSGSEKYNYNSFTWTITKIRKVDKSQYPNGIVYADDREYVSATYSSAPQIGDNINFSNFTWRIIDRDYNGSWKFILQRTLSEAEDGVYYLDLNRKL